MVRATNAGGEAQSIADVAIFEPKPDTMVEVHKTVVYENVQDKGVVQVIYFLLQTFIFFFLLKKDNKVQFSVENGLFDSLRISLNSYTCA